MTHWAAACVCVEALKLGANRIVSARYMRIVIGICIDIDCYTALCKMKLYQQQKQHQAGLANTLTG